MSQSERSLKSSLRAESPDIPPLTKGGQGGRIAAPACSATWPLNLQPGEIPARMRDRSGPFGINPILSESRRSVTPVGGPCRRPKKAHSCRRRRLVHEWKGETLTPGLAAGEQGSL